ncbi:MAG TPA: pitrilysin family protein [Terriglobales bacterium]|nr:pitrilysin family protein [Terriglobales bacterium]
MRRRLLLGLVLSLPLGAQGPAPAPIPINHAPLQFTLPRPVETVLPNGLTVLILENHRLPTVDLALEIHGAGGFDEPAQQPGLAVFTAEMMNLGTIGHSADQLAGQLADLGAHATFSSGYGSRLATLNASGLSSNFAQWFAIASDMLLHPSFPPSEWGQLEKQAVAQLSQQQADPQFLGLERLRAALYGTYPAAVSTTTPAALRQFNPDQFYGWHQQRYVPQNAILAIAGDVQPAALLTEIHKRLGGWRRSKLSLAPAPEPTAPRARRIFLIDRPGSVQTTMMLGNLAVRRTSADYLALQVLSQVLGAVPQGRLFNDLRSQQSLAYDVGAQVSAPEFRGIWVALGDFRTAVTGQALGALLGEVERLRIEPVPAAELRRAERAIVVRQALSLEQPDAVLGDWLVSALYHLPADYWDRFPARIQAVTAAEVQRAAQKYLDPATLQIVAVGDAAAIQPVLAKFGAVQGAKADASRH